MQTAIAWAVRLTALILAGGVAMAGAWLDWLAAALGGAAVVVALLPYWSHLADALGADAEQRWRDRYAGSMRANAEAMKRESREIAVQFGADAQKLALTYTAEAGKLAREAGAARTLAEERTRELAETRLKLARPKPRRAVLRADSQAPASSSPFSGSS